MGNSVSLSEFRRMSVVASAAKGKKSDKKKKPKKKVLDVSGTATVSDDGIVFSWEGAHISLNEWYASKHWTYRNADANAWHAFFKSFLTKPLPVFAAYDITIEYNSNLDPSNCITMIKLYEDMMQKEKIVPNDNKKYCRGIHLIPVLEMGKKAYKIIVNARK